MDQPAVWLLAYTLLAESALARPYYYCCADGTRRRYRGDCEDVPSLEQYVGDLKGYYVRSTRFNRNRLHIDDCLSQVLIIVLVLIIILISIAWFYFVWAQRRRQRLLMRK